MQCRYSVLHIYIQSCYCLPVELSKYLKWQNIDSIFAVESEVYAWGNNAMGQCGQGHAQSPITRPKRVIGLDGVSVHQVSAGTSHSVAWTALPTDRYDRGIGHAVSGKEGFL